MPDIRSELAILYMPDIRSVPNQFLIQGIPEMSRNDPGLHHVEVLHPLRTLLLPIEVSRCDPDPTDQNNHMDPDLGRVRYHQQNLVFFT